MVFMHSVMEEYNHWPSAPAYFTALAEIVSVDLGGPHRALETNQTVIRNWDGIGFKRRFG